MGRPKKNSTKEGAFEESLISAVFKRPCLYDLRDKDYSQTKKKDRKWKEISAEVKAEVPFCKTRWRSLRDTFKKVDLKARSSKSGDGLEDNEDRTVDWQWYSSLLFLRESNYVTRTTDSITTEETCEIEKTVANENTRADTESQSHNEFAHVESDSSTRITEKGRAQKKRNSASHWNSVVENLKEVVNKSCVGNETPSESFAVYIAKEMEEMSEMEQIDFKYDVIGIIRSTKRSRLATRIIEVEIPHDNDSGINFNYE